MTALILLLAVLVLAFWNGANDVSKGVATLAGSGVTRLRTAVVWGSIWTAVGGIAAAFASMRLTKAFSGSGLIPAMPGDHGLLIAVAVGALSWVAFATRTALPVSTTHAITGALLGAGIAAVGWNGIAWPVLATKFAAPLIFSPFVSLALMYLAVPLVHVAFSGLQRHCVCLEREIAIAATPDRETSAMALLSTTGIVAGSTRDCDASPATVARLNLMDGMHWLTAGATSFARGLNDTPKILSLDVVANAAFEMTPTVAFGLVALAMVAGSLLAGFRVTETLAEKVTPMTPTEGFAANLVTSVLVIVASRFALPVSTTHVSSGAIIGLGLKRGRGSIHWKTVRGMLGAWLITLPAAAALTGGFYLLIRSIVR